MRLALVAALALSACRRSPAPTTAPATDAAAAPSTTAAIAPSSTPAAHEASLFAIDRVVDEAILRGDAPGAVVVVWSHDRVMHRKAYGHRRVVPERVPMTVDTVFDLASLTKPLATAMSIHLLAHDKRLALADPARKYLPELGDHQAAITIEQLLLHTSGLPAADSLASFREGEAVALNKIGALRLATTPGTAYKYSDLGFVLLGAIVARASGEKLDAFAARRLFAPLGLHDTDFLPDPSHRSRAAPTNRDGLLLEGVVHDPRASLLGGVAGHAGLFSTADEVATIGRMLLHGGELEGARVLPAGVVEAMTAPKVLPNAQRTLGWDVHRGLSSGVGFGHTGFTGTSLFVDPTSQTVVVLLTSRLHPDEKGDVSRLRKELDEAVRASLTPPVVSTGIDVLESEGFARFSGKKIALVTNRSAVDHAGKRTVDVLREAGVNVVALLAPEHGLDATSDAFVASGIDSKSGLPIKSLYGADRKKPLASDLEGADTIVFDLQDAGVRFYTYETTLGLVLESAKELGVSLVVLDRPNPIGSAIEGPLLDVGKTSFTAYHRTPVRHGMTVGELARFFDGERKIGASLEVVKMRGYRRDMWFADTQLEWVAPSPNLRTTVEAALYPGVALLEGTNMSVGRGTSTPFEVVGAPFVDGERMAKHLNALGLAGVSFRATRFTPKASTHAGKECSGIAITVTGAFAPVRLGLALALSLRALHPDAWQSKNLMAIVGNRSTVDAIERGDPLDTIVASWKADEDAFAAQRKAYLVY
ncbi:MAG: exo-beta-N-acetylmuramidase NamZ domain-containing protein [Polyangiales bacterium]